MNCKSSFFKILSCSLVIGFCLVLSIVSCSKSPIGGQGDPSYTELHKREMNILIIGNSFSRDAFSYSPILTELSCRGIQINMSILQIGGVDLDTHYRGIINDDDVFILDQYTTQRGKWISTKNVRASSILDSFKWDLVILQDGASSSRDYTSVRQNIINVKTGLGKSSSAAEYAFMIIPPFIEGSASLKGLSPNKDFLDLYECANRLLNEKFVDYLIPCGTAIQHARNTYLDSLGDYGHLSYDGRHLQEGIPCLIEGYVAAQFFIDFAGNEGSIEDNELIITSSWVKDKRIPGQHGDVITGTKADYDLCKECALLAIQYPGSYDNNLMRCRFSNLFPLGEFGLEAHRGFSSEFPENTELSFIEAGKNEYYSGIETDIQMTKDGVLVCIHDDTISRTTAGEGRVSDISFKELQSYYIDGGDGWSDKYAQQFRVPTFSKYLEICKEFSKIPYVEIKNLPNRVVDIIVQELHDAGFSDGEFVLTSFELSSLKYAATICDTPLEYMKRSFSDNELLNYLDYPNLVLRPKADAISQSFVNRCAQLGFLVECYGIPAGDKALLEKLIDFGVEGGTCNSWKGLF